MAKKISQLESATDVTASDFIQIVDVEDSDMAPSGTNKKATAQLLANELGKLTNVTATGSTASRSLANRFADVVNVKDFGAVGNGVADDTAAIQAAINAVSTWGEIFIPEGTYKTASTITLPQSSGFNGLRVYGIGVGAVIKPSSSVSLVFSILGDFVTFDSIQIDGSLTTSATGLKFFGANNNKNVTVKNCYFASINKGIELRTDSWSIYSNRFTDVSISIDCANWAINGSCYDNYVLGGDTSIRLTKDNSDVAPKRAEGVRIFSNCFLNTNANARSIIVEAGLEVSIFNNIIDQTGTSGYAIYAQAMTGDDISHLKIHNNWLCGGPTSSGVALWVSQGSGANANNIFIEGNTLTSIDVNTKGIVLTNIAGYWITNNHFYCGNPSGAFLLNDPLTINTSNNGIMLGNRGLTTETGSVDNNTLRGQLTVANSTVGSTNVTAKRGSVETKIASSSTAGFTGTNSNNDFHLQANNVSRMIVVSGGNIIPAADNSITLGNSSFRWSELWAVNGTIQTSDERTKKDIEDSPLGLDFIDSLHPVSYKFKVGGNKVIRQVYRDSEGNEVDADENGASPSEIITEEVEGQRTHFGLIAQEVKAALPEGTDFGGWILTDKDDPDSEQGLRYEQFIAPLIKAVQELKARVEELESAP